MDVCDECGSHQLQRAVIEEVEVLQCGLCDHLQGDPEALGRVHARAEARELEERLRLIERDKQSVEAEREQHLEQVHQAVDDAKQKVMPPLDDELAKDTGEAETLDELREKLRQQLLENDQQDAACRFDVVAISQGRNRKEIRHLEDAFWLESDESEGWI